MIAHVTLNLHGKRGHFLVLQLPAIAVPAQSLTNPLGPFLFLTS